MRKWVEGSWAKPNLSYPKPSTLNPINHKPYTLNSTDLPPESYTLHREQPCTPRKGLRQRPSSGSCQGCDMLLALCAGVVIQGLPWISAHPAPMTPSFVMFACVRATTTCKRNPPSQRRKCICTVDGLLVQNSTGSKARSHTSCFVGKLRNP